MCNIKNKSNFKTVTVYKVVEKFNRGYLSFFARTPVRVGKIDPKLRSQHESRFSKIIPKMIGKCSGYALLSVAQIHMNKRVVYRTRDHAILKIKLGGEIISGTAEVSSLICPENQVYREEEVNFINNCAVYAGTEILSIEEI